MNLAPLSFWDVGSKLHVAPLEISPHFWTEGGLLSGDSCLFSLWKQDWFLHIIVFVLSWLRAFQHLVHHLLCLRSKCQARSPSLGRMEKLVFLSNKTRAAFRLGPKPPAYSLTTKPKPCYKRSQPMVVGSCCWLSHWKISLMDKSLRGFRHLALVGYQACKIISCIKSNLSKDRKSVV